MRVVPGTTVLQAAPGSSVRLDLEVTNTSDLIDGIGARVVGLDPAQVTSRPPLLPLFPDASGSLDLQVRVPPGFPAGRHPLTVELSSSVPGAPAHHVDVELVVAPQPACEVTVRPAVRRAHRRSRHLVECRNTGNVALVLALSAADAERLVHTGFSEPGLVVEPGTTASVLLGLRAPRRVFGGDLDRPVEVLVRDDAQGVLQAATVVLRQRPLVPRGALTVGVLLVILLLWAGAFLFGLTKVFDGDPLTKTAPASFFVAGASGDAALAASSTALDTVPKDGALAPGVGGGLSGTVVAASTGTGQGRVVVEVRRRDRTGREVVVASAATQVDGSFQVQGLLPGRYLLKYTAPGFVPLWFPASATPEAATAVEVFAQSVTREADVVLAGLPASVRGVVDTGEARPRPTTTVVARSLTGVAREVRVRTRPDGSFLLAGLPSPGTYEISFVTPQYVPMTVVEKVGAGQQRSVPTVRLSAGEGVLTGRVVARDPRTGATAGLGGVTVSTSYAGRTVTTTTPTQGAVGAFRLAGLPTPGTYVVSFSAPGFGAASASYTLTGGQSLALGDRTLVSGTGTVTGVVSGRPDGRRLGGVTVSVGGGSATLATTTVDGLGTYDLSGLAAPGDYTLTFSLPGYGPQTVPLSLDVGAPQQRIDVVLSGVVAGLEGRVVDAAGRGAGGATVTVTDGKQVVTTTSSAVGDDAVDGAWAVRGLTPGTWTVTVSRAGDVERTVLARVVLPGPTCVNLRLVPEGSTPTEAPPCA